MRKRLPFVWDEAAVERFARLIEEDEDRALRHCPTAPDEPIEVLWRWTSGIQTKLPDELVVQVPRKAFFHHPLDHPRDYSPPRYRHNWVEEFLRGVPPVAPAYAIPKGPPDPEPKLYRPSEDRPRAIRRIRYQ